MLKKILLGLAGLILALFLLILIYIAIVDSPIDPVAFRPMPKPPLTGVLSPNTLLREAEILAKGRVFGPEDVAVDSEGRIYGGGIDGIIYRLLPTGTVEKFAQTDGRPLGLHFDGQENLIVADAEKGLLSVDAKGKVTVLSDGVEGKPYGLVDDLDIASDGVIYFSDASTKFPFSNYKLDALEARPHGRLVAYYPATGEAKVLLRDLYFANGIAVGPDDAFVLVNETFRYRITRFWLKGEKKGTREVFADNMPGFPDGISYDQKGTFWVAIPNLRDDQIDLKFHPYPERKSLIAKLPKFILPQPLNYGMVVGLDVKGNIIKSLHDPEGVLVREITSVEFHKGYLYLGTLHDDQIARLKIP